MKSRIACHGKDLRGIDIHDDDTGIIGSKLSLTVVIGILFIISFNIFFHNILDMRIQRCNKSITILSGDNRPLQHIFIGKITVLSSIPSAQDIVIIFLQPVLTALRRCKTDHVTGKRIIRIIPDINRLEPDALLADLAAFLRLHRKI